MEVFGRNIAQSVTAFHTVSRVKTLLEEAGFLELQLSKPFTIARGGKYYVSLYDSSLAAFVIGDEIGQDRMVPLRIACSHTDFPTFKIKPEAGITVDIHDGTGYQKLNTEVYGGPILNTWMDRPLSIAGRVVVKGETPFAPYSILVDFKKPVLTIPNLAIHMNREVNKGVELNRQKDTLPLLEAGAYVKENLQTSAFMQAVFEYTREALQEQLQQTPELYSYYMQHDFQITDILDYELYLYQWEQGCTVGLHDSMYSSPRLDNLTSVYAIAEGLIQASYSKPSGLLVGMFYDNEEIGSKTKQGAASNILMLVLEKIYLALGKTKEQLIDDILEGLMLSVDVAHATHPNALEKSDITNKVILNNGIVIKEAANQSYAGDAVGIGIVKQLCQEKDIAYQIFVNRSDMQGGQTLGSILSALVPIRTVDIGVPLLAMHSARELMGIQDQNNLEKLLTAFYS